jgi:hypothetical protein
MSSTSPTWSLLDSDTDGDCAMDGKHLLLTVVFSRVALCAAIVMMIDEVKVARRRRNSKLKPDMTSTDGDRYGLCMPWHIMNCQLL